MKKKLCCIFMLIVLLLNSSLMIIISEAVDTIQAIATTEEKVKALAEINLTKYENYDTTTEGENSGSKGVLAQFNFKTGIEFAEGEEYIPIQKTETNIALPWIGDYRPSRVEVIVKSTQATNGEKSAKYEYHSSTGILSIIAENNGYTQNIKDARDEYEIICIYKSECYSNNKENNLRVKLNTYETLNNEEKTSISKNIEQKYTCKDSISGVISTEHETEDVYDGYINANMLNNANQYETTYNEKLKIMVSNKDIAQKIEVKETSETALYTEISIDKNNVLDIIGENGSIDILDESLNVVKTINKDSETDENEKIKITYKNREKNLIIQLNNIEKEGIIEIESSKVIEATTKITDNTISTNIEIKGINKTTTETDEITKYERQEQNNVQIKSAISDINTKLSKDILVNNIQNNVTFTATLKTDDSKYSLFKNPTISIEMPKEVKNLNIGTPEIMYDSKVFKIVSSEVSENAEGNKVINIKLQGEQTSYENSSIIEGTNIRIPLTIKLAKQLENKSNVIKISYTNERTNTIENKEMKVTFLNKVVNSVPSEEQIANLGNDGTENINTNTSIYEQDGIKAEIIQETGNTAISNNSTLYEQQIVKQKLNVTNNGKTARKVSLTIDIPEEMTYVKLQTGGYIKNEEKGYYVYSDKYEYEAQNEKQVTIDIDVNAGETKSNFIELKVNDLQDNVDEITTTIKNDLKVDGRSVSQYNIQNTVKQTKISAKLKCLLGVNSRKEWVYKLEVTNLTNQELKNVNIAFVASSFFNIEKVENLQGENVGKIGENIWTYTIDTLKPIKKDEQGRYEEGYAEFYIDGQVGEIDESKYNGYEINGVATIYGDDISKYVTNETRMNGYLEAVDTNIQSDKTTLKRDEEITYTVSIKNIGKTFGGFDTYTSINVKDIIPRELEPISVTYNDFEIKEETIKDEKDSQLEYEVQSYTEQEKTKDLSTLEIKDGYDETDAPNIDFNIDIPEGKTVVMTIKAKAKMISEKTDITNTITVTGENIKTKTASVANTVLNYNYEETTKPIDPENPTNPTDPSTPTDPADPTNPTNPTDPSTPSDNKISISGIAWIDENEDGKRTTDEKTYNNMTVMLYDYKNNTFVKENGQNKKVQTNSNGEYEFDDLDKGQYIVVFLYDTNIYKLTQYQKEDVIDSKNCDAITKTIEIDGSTTTAGLTNTLNADSSLKNIDIGLIENKEFDMELQKYINKITVQTNDGKTKTYTYNNKQFAKVEIHSKKINGATVIIEYKMVVTNKGEVAGNIAQLIDQLPSGLNFKSELNKDWYESNGQLYTNSLSDKTINPGESEEVSLILTKEVNSNNVGTVINNASIGISNNSKAIEDIKTENDSSNAQVIIGVSTGIMNWKVQTIGVLIILVALAVLIWKNRKILKGALFVSILALCLIGNTQQVYGASFGNPDENIKITGVFNPPGSSNMVYAIGTDGKRYHCVEEGKMFCEKQHGAKLIKHKTTYSNEQWDNVDDRDIELKDETNHKNVTFSKVDSKYNKVGPFKIKCNVSNANNSIKITYKNKNGQVKTVAAKAETDFQLIDFGWDKEFYIKIPNDVIQIDKITVDASYKVTQKGSRTEKHYYVYNTWQLSDDKCISRGETQNMARSEKKKVTMSREISKQKSLDISGPWVVTGDIKLDKVDSSNTNIKLKNAVFILQRKNYSKEYMSIAKNGKKVDEVSASVIELTNNSLVSTDAISAKIDGTDGYTIQFNATSNNATKFITNDNGNVTIKNLQYGSYTFTEVSNGNYGYTKMVKTKTNADEILSEKTVTIKNEKQVGELNIEKVDDRNQNKKLSNVEFVIQSSYNQKYIKIKSSGEWKTKVVETVTVDDTNDIKNNPTIQYIDNKEEATRFVTNEEGKLSVKNLLKSSNGSNEIKYNLIEVYNPNPLYEPNYESGYISLGTDTKQALNHQVYINVEGYVWEEIAASKNNYTNNLYNNTDALVEGIKVSLYKDNKLVASTITNAEGKYTFEKLKIDDLDKYHIEFEYDGLRYTTVQADISYTSTNYGTTSKSTEIPSGGRDDKDRQRINADFSEITNGKSRNNGKEVYNLEYDYADHVSTYKDHWGYQYNDNKTRLKVTPSNDYTIIGSTKTAGFNLKSAWEAQCREAGAETLIGLNMGIRRREQADLAIATDISNMNVIVQNYENTYTYENRKDYEEQNPNKTNYDAAKDGFGAEVKFGNKYGTSYSNRGLKMYTRRIYESDLAKYNQNYASNTNLMQIYVTYKITVKNQSNSLTTTANELVNYYDSRYEIADSWILNGNSTQQVGAKGWTSKSKYGNSYNQNGYIAGYTKTTENITIPANGKIEVYIKFKLKPEAVKALIEKQTTLNNVSEITAFSTKTQENGTWVPYASIDEDSNPGSIKNITLGEDKTAKTTLNGREYEIETKTLNEDLYEDDTDSAPSLVLGIEESDPTRGLSGTVFEDEDSLHNDDTTHPGEERLGDGILHTGGEGRKVDTNRISGAKVELLEYDENAADHIAKDAEGKAKIVTLYKLTVNNEGTVTTTEEKAETKTNEKGEYLFTGIIPGRYLIRYTYNNECYIVDGNGQQIEKINVRDYKSTVITSDIMKVALNLNKKYSSEDERKGDLNWILKYDNIPNNDNYTTDAKSKSKDLSGLIRYSGATDDLNKREEMDDLYYGSYGNNAEMTSDTAFFDVGVEYSEVKQLAGFANRISYTNYTDEYQLKDGKILVLDNNGKLKVIDTFYAVNPYQDFGIIERARQDYEVNKRISNLKITLANGQVLIEGNPYKQIPEDITNVNEYWKNLESASDKPLPYVKALPGQVTAEIDSEILQGATLNVEYTISIRNNSEKDFKYKGNQEYYFYGKNGQEEASTVIRKIADYMEDGISYDEQQNANMGWTQVKASELYEWTKDADNNNSKKQLISEDVRNAVEQGYVIAVTEHFYQPGQEIGVGKVGTIKIYGNKVISTSEKGTRAENHVEIIETMGVRSIKSSIPGNYNPKTQTPNELDDDMTTLIITTPTGTTENTIAIITATVIAMIALVGGIYFIKKKIIK